MSGPDSSAPEELAAFEGGRVDPASFTHAEHIRIGFEMLARHPFGETISRFSAGLRRLAAKAGKPEIYHETITVAFLALINERRVSAAARDWLEFKAKNADLMDKRCLEKWYAPEELGTEVARATFCLPRAKL
jgi:hypothetical protein